MSTVLICEDDALLAFDLAQSVEAAGHLVHSVHTRAESALSASEESPPDVAVIDLNLADGETGAGLAGALQKRGIRVIILSGHTNVNAGLGTVPHIFARKPVTDELVEALLA